MSADKLRILYHHRTRSADGQSVHIDELIGALRAEGHRVAIVAPPRISALRRGAERKVLPKSLYELAELGFSAAEFLRLMAEALRFKPHAIYQRANLHMLGGLWASRLLGIPLLVEVNAPLAQERGRFGGLARPALARWSEEKLWRGASHCLPVTHVLAGELEAAGVAAGNITVIANGVDMTKFAPRAREAAKRALDLQNKLVLGFVGYVREWHGIEQVIDLLAADNSLAHCHLLVVGDGPARPALEARAARAGITASVYFTGVMNREDIAPIAAAFDIALQPEVTAYASPLKLFEYMALGHAIVAPDSPNIREVLTDGVDAVLFPPGNPEGFADAVSRLAKDAALREKLSQMAAQNIVSRGRTWRDNARRVAALIRCLTEQAKAALPPSPISTPGAASPAQGSDAGPA